MFIANARKEELAGQVVVARFATTTQHGAQTDKTQTHMTEYYNLDVIISVGYRVKSQRGVEFRKWANAVLKDFILRGYAVNENRLRIPAFMPSSIALGCGGYEAHMQQILTPVMGLN